MPKFPSTSPPGFPSSPGQLWTYSTPSAQQVLQLLILLQAQQRAAGALWFSFRSAAHSPLVKFFPGFILKLMFYSIWKESVTRLHCQKTRLCSQLYSQGSFSSLFCAHIISKQEMGNRTSLTPTFLLSLRRRAQMNVWLPFSEGGSTKTTS